jgi:hypothetical protein
MMETKWCRNNQLIMMLQRHMRRWAALRIAACARAGHLIGGCAGPARAVARDTQNLAP